MVPPLGKEQEMVCCLWHLEKNSSYISHIYYSGTSNTLIMYVNMKLLSWD
jgi:hypothetical protein